MNPIELLIYGAALEITTYGLPRWHYSRNELAAIYYAAAYVAACYR